MTKILNLDEFESLTEKKLIINNKEHFLKPFTVGAFIDQLKEMEVYSKRTDVPVSEYLEQMIKTVGAAFPTIPADELRALPMHKIKKISEFVRGETEAEALAGAEKLDDAEPETPGKNPGTSD